MSENRAESLDDHRIRTLRGPKNQVDPFRPYHYLVEQERSLAGIVEDVLSIFLTNRECRYSCLMCDLWKNTTDTPVPPGAIPTQIQWALEKLPGAKQVKLYNSANFFDPGAVPPEDYPRIASLVDQFETVIVENHPLLTGQRCLQFARLLRPRLQVAMGLETINPEVLRRLNKKMVPGDFSRSVSFLKKEGIQTRAFILLRPPFQSEEEGIHWAKQSLKFAFECGTDCCTLIPTRSGNGIMELLHQEGLFTPPLLTSLEEVQEFGLGLHAGSVFVDTWDLQLFSQCDTCFDGRLQRLVKMNLEQRILPPVSCSCCS